MEILIISSCFSEGECLAKLLPKDAIVMIDSLASRLIIPSDNTAKISPINSIHFDKHKHPICFMGWECVVTPSAALGMNKRDKTRIRRMIDFKLTHVEVDPLVINP